MKFFLLFAVCLFLNAYGRPLYYMEEFIDFTYYPSYPKKDDFKRNIFWLEHALKSPIKPADRTDVPSTIKKEYDKYRLLTEFYANYLICYNYMKLAGEFNKANITWHDIYYAKEIFDSFDIAVFYYQKLQGHWKRVKELEKSLGEYKNLELENMQYVQEILYKVQNRVIDYNYISIREIDNIKVKKETLEKYVASGGN